MAAKTEIAVWKEEFAAANGRTLRWAQIQAKDESDEWRRFLAKKGAEKVGIDKKIENDVGRSDLQRATEAKELIYRQLVGLQAQLEVAILDPEKAAMAQSLSKAVRDTRKAWEDACKHEERLAVSARAVVPADRIRAVKASVVQPLAELVRTQRDWILSRLPADSRAPFIRVFGEYEERWNSAVLEIDNKFGALI